MKESALPKSAGVLILILLVVLVAGCVQTGTVAGGSGVVIEAFEPDFNDVFSGESVQLRVLLRNTGTSIAKKVKVQAINVPGFTSDFCENIEKMLPSDAQRGLKGEAKTCQNSFTTPTLPDKISIIYYPSIRLTYTYSTVTVKSLAVASYQELRRIKDTGGTIPAETVSSTSGPVSVNIVTKGPIGISSIIGGSAITFPIEVEVSNVGGGTICQSECTNENWNKVNIDISGDGTLKVKDCESKEVALFKGKSTTIGCKVEANLPQNSPIQGLITAKALDYGYMTDSVTQVKVTGRQNS